MVFLRHKASNMPHNVFVFQIVFLANLITDFGVIDKASNVYCIWNQHIVIFVYHLFHHSIAHISGLSRRSTLSSSVPASEVRQSASCTSRHSGRVRSTSSRRAMT